MNANAQEHNKHLDHYDDTLIILNELFLDSHEVLLKREQVLSIDSLCVNQRGLQIESFNISASTLGNRILLNSNKSKLTPLMHDAIRNKQMNYKFIYIKDIILQADDGRLLTPSLKSIKITFSN